MKQPTLTRHEYYVGQALIGLSGHEQFLIRAMADAGQAELPFATLIARAAIKIATAVVSELDNPQPVEKVVDGVAENP